MRDRLLQRLFVARRASACDVAASDAARARATPRVLLATATVANPQQFAADLIGCDVQDVDYNSTGNARTVRSLQPPLNLDAGYDAQQVRSFDRWFCSGVGACWRAAWFFVR